MPPKKDWTTLVRFQTKEQCTTFLSDQEVSIRRKDVSKSGTRYIYRCKHFTKFGCQFQLCLYEPANSIDFEISQSGEHAHGEFSHGLSRKEREIADSAIKAQLGVRGAKRLLVAEGEDSDDSTKKLHNYIQYEKRKQFKPILTTAQLTERLLELQPLSPDCDIHEVGCPIVQVQRYLTLYYCRLVTVFYCRLV